MNFCKLPGAVHSLDNFLDVCPPQQGLAVGHTALILDIFAYLNVPVAAKKVEGPSMVFVFLSSELDTTQLETRLDEAPTS